jgi:hypothetical protein
VLEDGRVQAFSVDDAGVIERGMTPAALPPGMPPLLIISGDGASLLSVEEAGGSPLTHPVPIRGGEYVAVLTGDGDLGLWKDGRVDRLPLNALPDGRILLDDDDRMLLLGEATDRYGHGVLGDDAEAAKIFLLESAPELQVLTSIDIPEPGVVEGIAPIWADLDGDGEREIIVTLSDADQGARLVVYAETGGLKAASEPIGRGFRWRHQLAVAAFGPAGEIELASVLTPHIGGMVQFFRMVDGELRLVAERGGFTSHMLGSRNLDMAVAGDFDGDGRVELVLPDQGRRLLGAIRRTDPGAEVAWEIELEGALSTNLAAVTLEDGSLGLGAGTTARVLRLWQGQ